MINPPFGVIKVFPPALLRGVERFGVCDMARVLVEGLRDKVHIPLSKPLTQAADEFDLWGIYIGHWDEVIGGGFLCGSGGKPGPQTPGLYIVHLNPRPRISIIRFHVGPSKNDG